MHRTIPRHRQVFQHLRLFDSTEISNYAKQKIVKKEIINAVIAALMLILLASCTGMCSRQR